MGNPVPDTVALDMTDATLVILDQTKLPLREEYLKLCRAEDIRDAIARLSVRGAPALGVAGAIGVYVCALRTGQTDAARHAAKVEEISHIIGTARPTAVNLMWAVNRMRKVLHAHLDCTVEQINQALFKEATAIRDEDIAVCRAIGEFGVSLIKDGDGILTHCNAGRLAAVRYGTALAPIYVGLSRGMHFSVYTDETRPLLQGARLSAYELSRAGADVTVLCDNMASSLMRAGRVQAVFVGCDRVAANGDTANKIGTSAVAVLARHYHIPFYVCAPRSTIDLSCESGEHIVIEQRPTSEVTTLWYQEPMAPAGVKVYNPAFDVTDADFITAFVTEKGIVAPKDLKSLF